MAERGAFGFAFALTMLATRAALADPTAPALERTSDGLIRAICHPNVAYLLFVVGLGATATEALRRRAIFPGIVGSIALVLSLVAFDSLPTNGGGALLIVVAFALFAVELSTGIGAFAIAAIPLLVVGSHLLYQSPARVSSWIVVVASVAVAMFFVVVVRATLSPRLRR
jgi:membrane-bound serine protease (ClpP class)